MRMKLATPQPDSKLFKNLYKVNDFRKPHQNFIPFKYVKSIDTAL